MIRQTLSLVTAYLKRRNDIIDVDNLRSGEVDDELISKLTYAQLQRLKAIIDRVNGEFATPPVEKRPDTKLNVERRSGDPTAQFAEAQQELAKSFLDSGMLDEVEIQTTNGPVKVKDIPRDAQGNPDAGWLSANCGCDACTTKSDGGMYL